MLKIHFQRFGETALHYAVRMGNKKIIELLLKNGADPFLEGKNGDAVTLAEQESQPEIIQLIKTSKAYKEGHKAPAPVEAAPVQPPKSITNVAYGYVRGKCLTPDCGCEEYAGDSVLAGACFNCSHYPVKHESKGKVEDKQDPKESPQKPPVSSSVESAPTPTPTPTPAPLEEIKKEAPEAKGEPSLDDLGLTNFNYDWRIKDANELTFEKELSEGAAAKVWRGKYRGQPVAIKVLKRAMDKIQLSDFQKEFDIYR